MLGDLVKEWLKEEDIFKKEVADDDSEWHYVVQFPSESNQVSDIIKPQGKDFILVLSGLALSEKHTRAFNSLPSNKKRDLMHQWKMDLLFRDAEFKMHSEKENLQRVDFSLPIYAENVKKSALMDGLREVFRCKMYIIWNLQHEFEGYSDVDAMFH